VTALRCSRRNPPYESYESYALPAQAIRSRRARSGPSPWHPPLAFSRTRAGLRALLIHDLPGLLWTGTDRPQEAPDLPNLGSHGLAQVHALASPAPMPEIAVALAPRSARASCPTVHAAACPTRYCCLSTGMTGSSPRSTAPSFGQIGEPSANVSLTHGVVCHS
jgi:hypothetical protein